MLSETVRPSFGISEGRIESEYRRKDILSAELTARLRMGGGKRVKVAKNFWFCHIIR